jgi:hypothetical protein
VALAKQHAAEGRGTIVAYMVGLTRALFVHGITWWFSLIIAYLFGLGVFDQYDKIRGTIDGTLGRPILPESVPAWWITIPFLIWVIAALAHKEAMRYWRAAFLLFGDPYVDFGPLYRHVRDPYGKVINSAVQYYFYMAKVQISNSPYKADDGRDVLECWAEIEVFDQTCRRIVSWRYPRWEENRQPGYADHPIDLYPDEENVRTLSANGRPSILCIALKPIDDELTYPIRGADQLLHDWRALDIQIPPGKYLTRLRVHGKGLKSPVERIYLLVNRGRGAPLDISIAAEKIVRQW